MLLGADELLGYDELTAKLRVSRSTVERQVRDGVIPFRWVGSRKRFYWPDVLAALPSTFVGPPGRASGLGQGAPDVVTHLKRLVPRRPRLMTGGRR